MKKKEHEKKELVIDTHRHLVSRAFAKQLLRDVQRDSFAILESQGLFADAGLQEVRAEFMPWLYGQVFENVASFCRLEQAVERRRA